MGLESELRALAAEIQWPQTPPLRPEVAPHSRPRRRGRSVALVLVVVGVALAAAFAVPESRAAILRFLGLGAVRVELVDRLPPAQERPLTAGLGPTISPAAARDVLGQRPLLPPVELPLHAHDGVVSLVFRYDRGPVLLSELGDGANGLVKKIALTDTSVRGVHVGSDPGLWVSGDEHVVLFPQAPPRLAGNVLVWQHGNLTLRLEGAHLTLRKAEALAAKIA